ncbi:MAG: hypothetical protein J6Z01_15005 [Bacteroidales bacterium]|nr:hypothetical protein [Bacteroidales bacterium]
MSVLCGCGNSNETKSESYLRLETVDSLLTANQDSLATVIFDSIAQPTDSSFDLAYYTFLSVRMRSRHNETVAPNELDYPISVFSEYCDTLKLCYSYNYKAAAMLNSGCKDSARFYNDKAEALLCGVDDYILRCNIYILGYQIGIFFYDGSFCIHYALKALELAESHNDKPRIAHSSHILAVCYNEQDNLDEADKYLNKCVTFIDWFEPKGKAAIYSLLGSIAEKKDQLLLAEQYYLKSVSIFDYSAAYKNLAKLYLSQDRIREFERYYLYAYTPTAYTTNAELMLMYAEALKGKGDFVKAADVYADLVLQKDSLIAEMEYKEKESKSENPTMQTFESVPDSNTNYIPYVLLAVVALSLTCFAWFYSRHQKIKNIALMSDISKRDAEVGRLQDEISLLQSKIGDFQHIIDDKRQNFEKLYFVGQSLYNDICNRQCIRNWTIDDEKKFVNYYTLLDYEYVKEIDNQYNNLSDHYKVILIIEKMIEDKNRRLEVLGMAASSYRSAKSRIEGMRK